MSPLLLTNAFLIISALFHLVITFIVSRSPKKKDQRDTVTFFNILSLSFFLWVISNLFIDTVQSKELVILWTKLNGISLLTLSPSFFLLSLMFPNNSLKKNRLIFLIETIIYIPLSLVMLFTNWVVEDAFMEVFPRSIDYAWAYTLVIIYVFLNLIFAVISFLRKTREPNPEYSLQAKYLVMGIVATGILSTLFNFLLPNIGIKSFTRLGPISTIIFSLTVTTAILKYRLFSLKHILSETIRYSLLTLWTLAVFIVVVSIHTHLWKDVLTAPSLIVGLIWGYLFSWSYFYVDRFINTFIIARIVDFDKTLTLDNLRSLIEGEVEETRILDGILKVLSDTLHIEKIAYFNLQTSILTFLPREKQTELTSPLFSTFRPSVIPNSFSDFDKTTIPEALADSLSKEQFHFFALVKGLKVETGLLFFSNKTTNAPYFQEEIDLIEDIAKESGVALERSSLYREVQQFNLTLQQKVDSATKELTERNQELEDLYKNLEEIYRKEKDLMDIAGHEFRTPASILKLNLYLLKKRISEIQKGKPDDKIQKYLDRLVEGTERQIKLVETFLESARIDNERFEIQVEQTDITKMAETAVSEMRPFAQQKKLNLDYNPPKNTISAEVDKVRIREVIDNLLNNAIKYTKKGGIVLKLSETDSMFSFCVKDTGIGIKPEDRDLLFKKFSRVDNYIGGEEGSIVRPGGTGLGLFVAKTIVDAHKGTITVESKPGEGSTFTVEIPKEQPSYVKRAQDIKKDVFNVEPKEELEQIAIEKTNENRNVNTTSAATVQQTTPLSQDKVGMSISEDHIDKGVDKKFEEKSESSLPQNESAIVDNSGQLVEKK